MVFVVKSCLASVRRILVVDYLAYVCAHELDLLVEVPGLEGVANAHFGVHRRVGPRDATFGVVQLAECVRNSALQRARNLVPMIIIT